MFQRTCPTCGGQFEADGFKPKTYCSDRCRRHRLCSVAGCTSYAARQGQLCIKHYNAESRRPATKYRDCRTCGKPFPATTNKKFCSVGCRERRPCLVDGCERFARQGDYCKSHYYRLVKFGDPLYRPPCAICGKPCDRLKQGTNPTCGTGCKSEQDRLRVQEYLHRSGRLRRLDRVRTCKTDDCHNLILTCDRKGAPRRCDTCLAPERVLAMSRRMTRYGITLEQYESMLDRQNGRCAVCRTGEPGGRGTWHIDHDHACCPHQGSCGRCVRGLLCSHCNTAAGLLQDDHALVRRMADYLARTRQLRLVI